MKIYREPGKIILAFFFFLFLSTSSTFLFGDYLGENFIAAVPLFFLCSFVLFEYQKYVLIRSLASELLENKQWTGFIYSGDKADDFFESFLILSDNRVIICTAYLSIQFRFNRVIGKLSYTKIFDSADGFAAVVHGNTVVIGSARDRVTIKSFRNRNQLIARLKAYGIPVEER